MFSLVAFGGRKPLKTKWGVDSKFRKILNFSNTSWSSIASGLIRELENGGLDLILISSTMK
jgi:hypothetical protein